MKQTVTLVLLLALALGLAACGGGTSPARAEDLPAEGEVLTARIVEDDGTDLLLAGLTDPYPGVYAVSKGDLAGAGVYTEDLRPGERGERVFGGSLTETRPARPEAVSRVVLLEDGRDRLYRLYLDVMEDLWEADPALRAGVDRIGFDLASTRLTPGEREALAILFARDHGDPEILFGTWQELADRGFIDGEDLVWEDGVLLSVQEKNDEAGQVRFDAGLWRSGLGACWFCDCASRRLIGGDWEHYTVGAQAVS